MILHVVAHSFRLLNLTEAELIALSSLWVSSCSGWRNGRDLRPRADAPPAGTGGAAGCPVGNAGRLTCHHGRVGSPRPRSRRFRPSPARPTDASSVLLALAAPPCCWPCSASATGSRVAPSSPLCRADLLDRLRGPSPGYGSLRLVPATRANRRSGHDGGALAGRSCCSICSWSARRSRWSVAPLNLLGFNAPGEAARVPDPGVSRRAILRTEPLNSRFSPWAGVGLLLGVMSRACWLVHLHADYSTVPSTTRPQPTLLILGTRCSLRPTNTSPLYVDHR